MMFNCFLDPDGWARVWLRHCSWLLKVARSKILPRTSHTYLLAASPPTSSLTSCLLSMAWSSADCFWRPCIRCDCYIYKIIKLPKWLSLWVIDNCSHSSTITPSTSTAGRHISELATHINLAHIMKKFWLKFPEDTLMNYIMKIALSPARQMNLVFEDL